MRSLDWGSYFWTLCGASVLAVVGLLAGWSYWPVPFALVLFAHGSQVRAEVEPDGARLERRLLWIWAWRSRPLQEPFAWVDGWGDELDPEALWVGERADGWKRESASMELGWSTCYSGDLADRRAAEFNAAVARLSS